MVKDNNEFVKASPDFIGTNFEKRQEFLDQIRDLRSGTASRSGKSYCQETLFLERPPSVRGWPENEAEVPIITTQAGEEENAIPTKNRNRTENAHTYPLLPCSKVNKCQLYQVSHFGKGYNTPKQPCFYKIGKWYHKTAGS